MSKEQLLDLTYSEYIDIVIEHEYKKLNDMELYRQLLINSQVVVRINENSKSSVFKDIAPFKESLRMLEAVKGDVETPDDTQVQSEREALFGGLKSLENEPVKEKIDVKSEREALFGGLKMQSIENEGDELPVLKR